ETGDSGSETLHLLHRGNNVIHITPFAEKNSVIQPHAIPANPLGFWQVQVLIILAGMPAAAAAKHRALLCKQRIAIKRVWIGGFNRNALCIEGANHRIPIDTPESF